VKKAEISGKNFVYTANSMDQFKQNPTLLYAESGKEKIQILLPSRLFPQPEMIQT